MNWHRSLLLVLFSFFLNSLVWAQSAPAPATAPTAIPIIKLGDQVKPMPAEKTPKKIKEPSSISSQTQKPKKEVQPIARVKGEEKKLKLESKKLIHSKDTEIGDPVYFSVVEETPQFPKGALVFGKVLEIQRMGKNEPGKIKVSLETMSFAGAVIPLGTTLEVTREKGKDSYEGKEVFILLGSQQEVLLSKKLQLRKVAAKRAKPAKGLLIGSVAVQNGKISYKFNSFERYEWKVEVYFEPPPGIKIEDIQQDSFKLTKVGDFVLPQPISTTSDKIKVADHDKNKVQDLRFKFDGWELIKYFPVGESALTFFASTTEGKPIEAQTIVKVEME